MIAYQCSDDGVYLGQVQAQSSPLEPGVFCCPGHATFDAPPDFDASTQQAVFDFANQAWIVEDVPPKPDQDGNVAETPKAFINLPVEEKRAQVIGAINARLATCSSALETFQWILLAGGKVDNNLASNWVAYRKALLALPNSSQGASFFIKLANLQDYPLPEQPVLPTEA